MIKTKRFSIYLTLLLLLSSMISAFSQFSNSRFGISAGLNFLSLDEGRYSNYDFFLPGTGFTIGLSYDVKVSSKIEINLEALISKKTVKEKYIPEDSPIYFYSISDYRLHCTDLSFPITLNYSIDRLGLQAGLFTDVKLNKSFSGQNVNQELSKLNFDMMFNGGFVFGGHYDFYNLEVGLRKFTGILNQENITIDDGYFNEVISLYKSNLLQFYIKYNL